MCTFTTNSCAVCQASTSCDLELSDEHLSARTNQVFISTSHMLQSQNGLWSCLTMRSSSRASSRTGLSLSSKLLVCLVLSILPVSAFAFNSDRTTQSNQEAPLTNTGKISCPRHFGHRVQSCVAPFTSLLDLYNANADHLGQAVTIAKHICIEYQMVLLCLHSALSDCPTLKNLKRVQDTLDSQWVTRINNLCSIQSKTSTESKTADHRDLSNYIANKNTDKHMDSNQIAREILQASLKTRAELEQEIISGHIEESPLLSIQDGGKLFPSAAKKDLDLLNQVNQKLPLASGSDAKVELNIVNFIQNYNYATAQRSDQFKHATIRLIHADYNSCSRVTFSQHLMALCSFILMMWLAA